MKRRITIFTLACHTNGATEARVFTTEREAYIALIDYPALNLSHGQKVALVEALDSVEEAFFQILAQYKGDQDAFSVGKHSLELEF